MSGEYRVCLLSTTAPSRFQIVPMKGNGGFPWGEHRIPTEGTTVSHAGNIGFPRREQNDTTPQGGYPVSETYSNMENVIQIGQVVQPSVLSNVERTVKNLKAWLSANSPSFSALAGEDVSRADVVKAHLYLFIVFVIGVVVSQMGGAL